MMRDDDSRLTNEIAQATRRVLSGRRGQAIHLGPAERIDQPPRPTPTLRFVLLDPPDGAPSTVVVKCVRSAGALYDPAATERGSRARHLGNEWAGLAFLERMDGGETPPVGPRCFGGDRAAGIVVMEDLGDGDCLADFLLGDDPARAEAGLLAYARALGRMHAATAGREGEYQELRAALGFPAAEPGEGRDAGFAQSVAKLREGCAALDLPPAPAVEDDVAAVDAVLREPGPFLAFTPADTCPDNQRFFPGRDGEPDAVRLFDFAHSQFRHALLDAAYGRVPFPTCWCANRLPAALPARMEAAYRAALVKGVAEAADDALFQRDLVAACAYWTISTVAWDLPRVLEEDRQWGIATRRQRALLRLDTLADATVQFGHVTALGVLVRQMGAILRQRWPETEMPLYPAFRGRP